MDKEETAMSKTITTVGGDHYIHGYLTNKHIERHATVKFWLDNRLPTWLIELRLRMAKT